MFDQQASAPLIHFYPPPTQIINAYYVQQSLQQATSPVPHLHYYPNNSFATPFLFDVRLSAPLMNFYVPPSFYPFAYSSQYLPMKLTLGVHKDSGEYSTEFKLCHETPEQEIRSADILSSRCLRSQRFAKENPPPRIKNKRSIWLPKSEIHRKAVKEDCRALKQTTSRISLEFDESSQKSAKWTTIMIRNIPNTLSREMMIELLDKHCEEENDKAVQGGSRTSEYDFLYLPMDFRSGLNLGYAFVNFTTSEAAGRFYRKLHHRNWEQFKSKKVSHLCYARIQGKEALFRNFSNSKFACESDEYLPVVISPPANGSSSSRTSLRVVGHRVSPLAEKQ